MKYLSISLLTFLLSIDSWAEDEFPFCKGDMMTWTACTYNYDNGDSYKGSWKDGNQHGQGTYTWSDDSIYNGEWKDNKMSGRGTYIWSNDDLYMGQWLDGKRHGYGTITYMISGNSWNGEWKNGKKVQVTDAVKNIIESSKKKDMKDTYSCEYEFNNEIFRFVLKRVENSFLNVQGYESEESILWEEEDILILGSPIQDKLENNQLIYRTITLDKESGKFNTVAVAEPNMKEYEDGIWSLVNGQCEKLN